MRHKNTNNVEIYLFSWSLLVFSRFYLPSAHFVLAEIQVNTSTTAGWLLHTAFVLLCNTGTREKRRKEETFAGPCVRTTALGPLFQIYTLWAPILFNTRCLKLQHGLRLKAHKLSLFSLPLRCRKAQIGWKWLPLTIHKAACHFTWR